MGSISMKPERQRVLRGTTVNTGQGVPVDLLDDLIDNSSADPVAEANHSFEPDESEQVDPEHQEGHTDHTIPEDD